MAVDEDWPGFGFTIEDPRGVVEVEILTGSL